MTGGTSSLLAILSLFGVQATEPAAPAMTPWPEAVRTAQSSHSTKCKTAAGLCYVPAAPVGSPCSCSGSPGTIIR